MRRFGEIGKPILELLYKWALNYPTTFKWLDNISNIFLVKKSLGDRDISFVIVRHRL